VNSLPRVFAALSYEPRARIFMPQTTSLVPKLSDAEILTFLLSIARLIGAAHVTVKTVGGSADFQIATDDENAVQGFQDEKIHRLSWANVGANRFSVTVDRQTVTGSEALLYDSLTIHNSASDTSPPRQGIDEETVRAIQDLVAETFGHDQEKVAGLFRNPKLFRDLLASHHRQNIQLQKMVLDVGKQAADARTSLEQEFARRRVQLDEEFSREEAARSDRLQKRLAELSEQQELLSRRERELDDRSNTHARRELHRDLKAKIAQRADSLRVTPETTANRRPIHVAVIASMIFLGILVVYFSLQFGSLPQNASAAQTIVTGLKPASITLALLGLMAWYLRWMNRWFERYADAEFHLKQFELDIDRASWVVEAALEWKLSQDRPMPEHLLETISRNLFSKGEKDDSADMHPADYLASAILGRASALNLKVPGGEISLTGRDLKKLQKDEAAA